MMVKFNHVHLISSNLEEGISFFTEVLGAELIVRRKFGTTDGASLNLGGTVVNLRLSREEEHFTAEFPPSHFGYHHIAVEVKDLDAIYQELVRKGIAFTKNPAMGAYNRNAFIKGPDNILIELMER